MSVPHLRSTKASRSGVLSVLLLPFLVFLLSGCGEADVPTEASGPTAQGEPSAAFSVTPAEGGVSGLQFAFLPPMGTGVDAEPGTLVFPPELVVEVCPDGGCEAPLAIFTPEGTGNARIRVASEGHHLLVHWRPLDTGTPPGSVVRIRVRTGDRLLGTSRLQVVSPGPAGRGTPAADGIATVLERQSFAIRFMITGEPGSGDDPGSGDGTGTRALVGDAGGTLEIPGATLAVPPGALDEAVEIEMTRLPDPEDAAFAFVSGTRVSFSPSGLSFATPASLILRFDPAGLPVGTQEEWLAIHRLNADGTTTPLPTTVDLASGSAVAFLDGFSQYILVVVFPGSRIWVGGAEGDPRDWHLPANWSPASVPSGGLDAVVPAGTEHLPRITSGAAVRSLRVLDGATLELAGAGIEVHGTLSADGPIIGGPGSVILEGAAEQSVRGTVPDLLVARGTARLSGDMTVTGHLQVNGPDAAVSVGAHALVVEGDLETAGATARLVMDHLESRVTVFGDARFTGGAGAEPTLERGRLILHGNLIQGQRPDALRASGNHQVVMAGSGTEQVVNLADPGPGGSYLSHLETANPGVVTFARGGSLTDLTWADAGVGGRIAVGSGHTLVVLNAMLRGPLLAPELRVGGTLAAAEGTPYLVDRTVFAWTGNPAEPQGVPALDYLDLVVEGENVRIAAPWVRVRRSLLVDAGNLRIAGNVLEVEGGIRATPGAAGGILHMVAGDRVLSGQVDLRTVRPHFAGGTLWIKGDLVGPGTLVGTGTAHRTVFHGTFTQTIEGAGGFALGQVVLANAGDGVRIRTPALQASGPDAGSRFLELVGNTRVEHAGDDHVSVGVAVFRGSSRTHFASPTDRALNCVWALDEDGRVITVEPGNTEVGCARFGDPTPRPTLPVLADFTPPSRLEVTILSPGNTDIFDLGDPITFQAGITLGGAPVTSSFAWFSSRDGALGSGSTLVRSDLSVGVHLVEVQAEAAAPDGSTLQGSTSIVVVVRGEEEEPPAPPVLTSIDLSVPAGPLLSGESVTVQARGLDQYGLEMPEVEFTWTSSDACVASVNVAGTVTAHSPGSAVITVRSGAVSAEATVEVAGADATLPTSVLGNWRVCRRTDGEFLYRIEITTQEETGRITGRVYHSNGTSSFLSGNWGPTFYNVTWTRLVQGGERTFAINDLVALSGHHLRGRYNDRITLSTYDVELRRIPQGGL